jgi:hypothetical protein
VAGYMTQQICWNLYRAVTFFLYLALRRIDGYLTTLSVTQTVGCLLNDDVNQSYHDVIHV